MAYDVAAEVVHLLNATAAHLLAVCDGVSDLDELVASWASPSGAPAATVARDVARGIEQFMALGLVGRDAALAVLPVPKGSPRFAFEHLGAVHAVLDEGVQFRSPHPGLLRSIDAALGMSDPGRVATIAFDVTEDAGGGVHLHTESEWSFPSLEGCLEQLPTVINEYAVRSAGCVVLHAGAVRSPAGAVVVMPAPPGAGKSTLTAALIQGGWDYVTDEAVGIRAGSLQAVAYAKPLALDPASRAALGLPPTGLLVTAPSELRSDVARVRGDAGPVTRVVLPQYVAGAAISIEPLSPSHAIQALIGHATNLGRVGQPGLEALCALAASVPVHRLVHGEARHAVAAIEALG